MPAGHSQRNPSSETPNAAHSNKATHIRNKDGTKLITVPPRKVSNSADSSGAPTSPTLSNAATPTMPHTNGASAASKKKNKKKRGKQQHEQIPTGAQGRRTSSAQATDSGHDPQRPSSPSVYQQEIRNSMAAFSERNGGRHPDVGDHEDDDDYYSEQENGYPEDEPYSPPPHAAQPEVPATTGKKKKKKNKKKSGASGGTGGNGGGQVQSRKGKDRIWNTSTAEERERIKDFWLSLGEDERKSLVKVEKEAVLKKMKEQQKHSCSCSVCGRKRNAIEEELEVLYDAYYEELEQYANQQQTGKFLPPGTYASNVPSTAPPLGIPPPPRRENIGRRIEDLDEDDEEYDDEEDQYEETDGLDRQVGPPNDLRPDFFNFGNSLTVQGGILTVADDLLKNDGKKFIEMMEQLAERRMQREEEANAAANGNHSMPLQMHPHTHPHSHPHTHSHGHHPAQPEYEDEEDYDDEEDDEEYEEDEEDEEEQDTMTEEQRMEEGRRMFQIFAARMFEQRVLTAYREKVARERQQKLLEELEEETRLQAELELKRAQAKDRQKEKKRLQKLAKEEEQKRKAAEKAAEEAEKREQEARKAEEQRKRKEEQRLKREAEKKAALEEKQRQEEERKKRIQEEREREAERERKKKEHQERERKRKEEQARKAKEEKEAREKENRERKEREEREKKERDAVAKREAAEKERARYEQENKAKAEAAIAAIAARTIPTGPSQSNSQSKYGSPHLNTVTPAIPQTGTLGPRPRNSSQQDGLFASQASSPKTPSLAPRMGSGAAPSTPVMSHGTLGGMNMPMSKPPGFSNIPGFAPGSPLPQNIPPPPGVPPPEGILGSMSPLSMGGQMAFMPSMGHRPSLSPNMTGFPPSPFGAPSPSFRGFAHPVGQPIPVSSPPGMQMPIGAQSRPFMDMPNRLPPGVPIGPPASPFTNRVDPVPLGSHNRVPSGGFEPIGRPTPIQRPSSVAPKHIDEQDNGVEEISKVMGSRALLDDDDVMPENVSPNRRPSMGQFAPRPIRSIPLASPIFSNGDAFGDASWSNPRPLGGSGSLPSTWANPGAAWADVDVFSTRRRAGRHNQLRLLACQKYRELAGPNTQFIEVSSLERAIHSAAPDLEFTSDDFTAVLETVGDQSNGGGNFLTTTDANGRNVVAFENIDTTPSPFSVGEIGSPRLPGAIPFRQQPLGHPRHLPGNTATAGFTSFG